MTGDRVIVLLRILCLAHLVALCGPARAEEDDTLQPMPAGIRELVVAHNEGQQARFEADANSITDNPWMLVDLLLVHGEPDVALAYALAVKRPDTARLPAYIEGRRGRAHDARIRRLARAAEGVTDPAIAAAHLEPLNAVAGQGDAFERVIVEQRRGELLTVLERFGEASEAHLSAASTAEGLGWLSLAAEAFMEGGMQAYRALDFEAMLAAFRRAAAVEQGRGRHAQEGRALMHLGSTHVLLGDYDAAYRLYEEAEGALTAAGWTQGLGEVLLNRAEAYRQQGRYADAMALIERARAIIPRDEHPLVHAWLDMLLGSLLYQFRQHDRALGLFRAAHAVFVAAKEAGDTANALGNMGLVYLERGEYERALDQMRRARAIHEELGNPALVTTTLINEGWIYMKQGAYAKARPVLDEAVAHARHTGDSLGEAMALDNLADVYRHLGRAREALDLDKAVVRIGARLESMYILMSGHVGVCEDWLALGKPDRAFRAAERAMEYSLPLVSGLAQDMAADARKQLSKLHAAATRAALAWKNPAALLTAMESARAGALLEALENRHAIRTAAIPEDLRQAEQDAQRAVRIARLHFQNALKAGVLPGIRRQRKALERAREGLHDAVGRIQLRAKAAAGVLYPVPAALGDIQPLLTPGTALVSYSLAGDQAAALVVTRTQARIVELGSAQDLRAAAALRFDDPRGEATVSLGTLRTLLIDPLALSEKDTHLLVSPDGPLGYVPFGALAQDRVVSYVPSGTAYRTLSDQGGLLAGQGVLALGDPDYRLPKGASPANAQQGGMRLVALPATRAEVERVGDVVLVGGQATPAGFYEALGKRSRWHAVHFACHGLIDADHPMNSALALSYEKDGRHLLTCLDVVRGRIPADLAVLSACETGKGKLYRSEGLVGLTQAFMLAGAPRVIVSLWKVDDEATQALMVRFYELWRPAQGEGLPAAEALAKAQAHVRTQPKWKHPYFWAAWVLWGLPV